VLLELQILAVAQAVVAAAAMQAARAAPASSFFATQYLFRP
jgi:hypothetical protein